MKQIILTGDRPTGNLHVGQMCIRDSIKRARHIALLPYTAE